MAADLTVTAPLVIARRADGTLRYAYTGELLDSAELAKGEADRFIADGTLTKTPTPKPRRAKAATGDDGGDPAQTTPPPSDGE